MREKALRFASMLNTAVPLPLLPGEEVTWRKLDCEMAFHPHPGVVVTDTCFRKVAAAGTFMEVGVTAKSQI